MSDDLHERVAALEATLHVEVRALHAKIDHLDECLDRRTKSTQDSIEAAMESIEKKIAAAVEFPKWGVKLFIGAVVLMFLSALGALVWSAGKETTRVIRLPTTPPPVERGE